MLAHPVETGHCTRFEKYESEGVTELGLSPSVAVGVYVDLPLHMITVDENLSEPIAKVDFDGSWQFERNRGGILLMLEPHVKFMKGFPTRPLMSPSVKPILKGKVVCTDVTACPAFCLYLGNAGESQTYSLGIILFITVLSAKRTIPSKFLSRLKSLLPPRLVSLPVEGSVLTGNLVERKG
jgi:hypothetical protein